MLNATSWNTESNSNQITYVPLAAWGTPGLDPLSYSLGERVAHRPARMFMFSSVLKPDPPQAGIFYCTFTVHVHVGCSCLAKTAGRPMCHPLTQCVRQGCCQCVLLQKCLHCARRPPRRCREVWMNSRSSGCQRRERSTAALTVLRGPCGHYYCMLSCLLIALERHVSVPCGEAGRPCVHGPASLETQDRQDLVEPDCRLEN